ncbi:hypothetical protein CB0940_09341 [Cercospora beticola]|uniref:Uncharacterized protein n=1 Tax=Cercospora beticola TaxID=122368 RepID=A0A2G5HGR9_CERBT|nr:hypothetical protein CB0940_09341 [Cercospora beticola]PIA91786.1 hypothetical protein CB0940_09341 [Cercospora beticola]
MEAVIRCLSCLQCCFHLCAFARQSRLTDPSLSPGRASVLLSLPGAIAHCSAVFSRPALAGRSAQTMPSYQDRSHSDFTSLPGGQIAGEKHIIDRCRTSSFQGARSSQSGSSSQVLGVVSITHCTSRLREASLEPEEHYDSITISQDPQTAEIGTGLSPLHRKSSTVPNELNTPHYITRSSFSIVKHLKRVSIPCLSRFLSRMEPTARLRCAGFAVASSVSNVAWVQTNISESIRLTMVQDHREYIAGTWCRLPDEEPGMYRLR